MVTASGAMSASFQPAGQVSADMLGPLSRRQTPRGWKALTTPPAQRGTQKKKIRVI
jgi:hypothetical protein